MGLVIASQLCVRPRISSSVLGLMWSVLERRRGQLSRIFLPSSIPLIFANRKSAVVGDALLGVFVTPVDLFDALKFNGAHLFSFVSLLHRI